MIKYLKTRGITLLEVLIVIGILSILAASSSIFIPPLINKAYDARRKADLHSIKVNMDVYYSFAEQYPEELPDCGQPLMYKSQSILNSIPCDPVTKEPYFYQIRRGDLQSFRVYTLLSNLSDISISDVGCLGGCGPDCFYGGREGSCELYQDAELSLCPNLYYTDSVCKNECGDPKNRCENASGKQKPY
ncbi:MAG: General secretion pathway protein G [Candidatus Collierbacteria bacterium GW2011_GWB2_42_12]|nr:MAG: General secretion pathway protein G [Candidatus Collierbacteria bacterium GW2011_GWB2_42_12]